MDNKSIIAEKARELVRLTTAFCNEYIDEEYKRLCEKLAMKMSRKRNVPFLTGRIEIWAAATIHAIGSINFLFDKSFQPYVSADDIASYFGTSKSTTSQKAKLIREMFKMGYYDKEFSTASMKESNPFANMVTVNGLIVPISSLPPELQQMIRGEK